MEEYFMVLIDQKLVFLLQREKSGCIEADVVDYNKFCDTLDYEDFDPRKVGALKYDSHSKQLITFDNPQCARIKASFVLTETIGWWDVVDSAGDVSVTNDGCLVKNFVDQLGGVEYLKNQQITSMVVKNLSGCMDISNNLPHS